MIHWCRNSISGMYQNHLDKPTELRHSCSLPWKVFLYIDFGRYYNTQTRDTSIQYRERERERPHHTKSQFSQLLSFFDLQAGHSCLAWLKSDHMLLPILHIYWQNTNRLNTYLHFANICNIVKSIWSDFSQANSCQTKPCSKDNNFRTEKANDSILFWG